MVSSSIRAAKHTPEAVCSCVPCAQWCWSLLRQISRYTFKLHFQLWGNNMILYSELKGKSSAYKAVKEQWWWFKGIVHSELKSLSSFTHAVPKLSFQTFFIHCGTYKKIFYIPIFSCNGSQWGPKMFGSQSSSNYFLLCSTKHKVIQIRNNILCEYHSVSKWQNFHLSWCCDSA